MKDKLLVAALCVCLGLFIRASLPVQAQSGGPLVVTPGQVVTLSADATYAGITVNAGGELRFAPGSSVTISTTANAIISGTLTMRPSSAATIHTLRFVGINEANYVGGGLVPLATDVGLWVVGAGKLDLAGSTKTAWTHAAGSIAQGANQVTLLAAPAGWQVGDEISIVPTEPPSVGAPSWNGFDLRTIIAINGATVTLSAPTARAHPIATNPFSGAIYTAEVLNLTRNVRIEGTGNGEATISANHRAHIFIRSTQPQSIRYAAIRYMGPRKPFGSYTESILGRYGLHFHMSGDGSRGSLVEGVVVRDAGSHAFVPHASHGITFQDTISYNTFENAYWWDGPPCTNCGAQEDINDTNDLLIDHAVAAIVRWDPNFRGYRIGGFILAKGADLTLILRNSVAVGVQGAKDAAGYIWPEGGHAVWDFHDNIAHNNAIDGIFVWQNDAALHTIKEYAGFNNGQTGIDHGAYRNGYRYSDVDLWGNGMADPYGTSLRSRATAGGVLRPDGYTQSFERIRMTGLVEVNEHATHGGPPVLFKDCILAGVRVNETANDDVANYDFVNCVKPGGAKLAASDFNLIAAWPTSRYRVQNGAAAWQLTGAGTVTAIAPFYVLPLSPVAQQIADLLAQHPEALQELIEAGVLR